MAASGAFDDFNNKRWNIYYSSEKIVHIAQKSSEEKKVGQKTLFSNIEEEEKNIFFDTNTTWNSSEYFLKEFESLGYFASGHPLQEHWADLNNLGITKASEIKINATSGKLFELSGFVIKKDEKNTNYNKKICNLLLSDPTGVYEINLFDHTIKNIEANINKGEMLLINAMHKLDHDGRLRLTVNKVRNLEGFINKIVKKYKIYIRDTIEVKNIKDLLSNTPNGNTKINFVLNTKTSKNIEIYSGFKILHSSELFERLKNLEGISNIEKLI